MLRAVATLHPEHLADSPIVTLYPCRRHVAFGCDVRVEGAPEGGAPGLLSRLRGRFRGER